MAARSADLMLAWRISWSYVSTRRNPQCYDEDGNPIISAGNVPEALWEPTEVVHSDPARAAYQMNGTLKMMENGALIRDVKLYQTVMQKPVWHELASVYQISIEPHVQAVPPEGAVAP